MKKHQPKWLMAAELVETTRLYARHVARIEPEWIEQVGAHLVKREYYDPHWERKPAQVTASEARHGHDLMGWKSPVGVPVMET